jgi:hypothetical protein
VTSDAARRAAIELDDFAFYRAKHADFELPEHLLADTVTVTYARLRMCYGSVDVGCRRVDDDSPRPEAESFVGRGLRTPRATTVPAHESSSSHGLRAAVPVTFEDLVAIGAELVRGRNDEGRRVGRPLVVRSRLGIAEQKRLVRVGLQPHRRAVQRQ